MDKVRIDKFLWAVRLFKTRTQAAEACNKGHVLINDNPAKPSKEVKVGDQIAVKYKIIYRRYKILQLLDKRVGAKLVDQYIEEITSQEDLMKLKIYNEYQKTSFKRTEKGRPTKKQRRQWDEFFGK